MVEKVAVLKRVDWVTRLKRISGPRLKYGFKNKNNKFYSVMWDSKMCGCQTHVNSPCLRKPAKVHATFKSYRTCSTYATSIYDYQFLNQDPQITVSVATGNIAVSAMCVKW